MNRFCRWLGDWKRLFLSSFLFDVGHFTSRFAEKGFAYVDPATQAAAQAFIGGLIFGYLYLRFKNIWPSAIVHVSSNMYFYQILKRLGF